MSHAEFEELSRLDALLMRVLDEEATPAERRELLALADADARLAELTELRDQLREALRHELAADAVEVVGAVMAALQLDDGWDSLGSSLRDALSAEAAALDAGLDGELSEAVMAAIDGAAAPAAEPAPEGAVLSALHDGELSSEQRVAMAQTLGRDRAALETMTHYADIGHLIRGALDAEIKSAELSSVWRAVAPAIGLSDPEAIPGWEPVGEALRRAVADSAALSAVEASAMADRIMNRLPVQAPRPAEPELEDLVSPGEWRSWIVRISAPALLLAAGLLLVFPTLWQPPQTAPEVGDDASPELAHAIQAEPESGAVDYGDIPVHVESLETADDVMVQVLQFDEDGPLFLMIDADDLPDDGGDGASL